MLFAGNTRTDVPELLLYAKISQVFLFSYVYMKVVNNLTVTTFLTLSELKSFLTKTTSFTHDDCLLEWVFVTYARVFTSALSFVCPGPDE